MSAGHDPGTPGGEADLELDCRGMRCPRPVIELARAAPGLAAGSRVAVVSTDPASRTDIPAWCRMRAQGYLGEDTADDGVPRYWVRLT